MLRYIREFERYVLIDGFKNVKIKDVDGFFRAVREESKSLDVEIQFFDAQLVCTWQHLYFAALNALTAFQNKGNISKSLAMESLLYASAQHQIRKATELLGIQPDSLEIAVLVIGRELETVRSASSLALKHVSAIYDDAILELSKEKAASIRRVFGISSEELEAAMRKDDLEKALTDLVIERMALLATKH